MWALCTTISFKVLYFPHPKLLKFQNIENEIVSEFMNFYYQFSICLLLYSNEMAEFVYSFPSLLDRIVNRVYATATQF